MIKTIADYQPLPDEELFRLFQLGDNRAFEEIFRRYNNLLVSLAERILGSRPMAEDIVQEIFLSLCNRRGGIEIQVSLRAYLMKSMKFKILNEFRSSGVRRAYKKQVDASQQSFSVNNLPQECEMKELTSSIEDTIKTLPDKCRTAFLLSRSEDLSYKAISGFMGISISTVEKHISKALRLLKSNLPLTEFSIN